MLGSLLGSPGGQQNKVMDLDDLSNNEEGDGIIDQPKGPTKQNDLLTDDFGGNGGPSDLLGKNINTDIDNLFNPRVPDQIPMDQDTKKAAAPP